MKRKEKFYFGLTLLLISLPQVVKANAQDEIGSVLIPLVIGLINIPAVIAFLVLRNIKPGKALAINSFIWIIYMIPLTHSIIFWAGTEHSITESDFLNSNYGLATWMPMTFVFILTVVAYWNSRNKEKTEAN